MSRVVDFDVNNSSCAGGGLSCRIMSDTLAETCVRISQDRLTSLMKWYKAEGLVPKEKKSGGRSNVTCALHFDDIKRVIQFVTNYASDHALVLPGRVPGFRRDDVKLLPSSHTKKVVYVKYTESLKDTNTRVVGESSFYSLWNKLVPYIVSAKPMTDLCWICQKNNTLIYRFVLSFCYVVWYVYVMFSAMFVEARWIAPAATTSTTATAITTIISHRTAFMD